MAAGAFHDDVLSAQDVAYELGVDAVVAFGEVGAVDVAGAGYHGADAVLVGVAGAEGLGGAFAAGIA